MAIPALVAAKHICKQSNWTLSNLEVQKILYIAHMFYLGEHDGEPLVKGNFEAWNLGPVHPQVYRHLKIFGADPVSDIFRTVPDLEACSERDMLDEAVDKLAGVPGSKLVAVTHWEKGAWAKNYYPNSFGVIISNSDILEEYMHHMENTEEEEHVGEPA